MDYSSVWFRGHRRVGFQLGGEGSLLGRALEGFMSNLGFAWKEALEFTSSAEGMCLPGRGMCFQGGGSAV